MANKIHIVIAEPSAIIRSGVFSVIQKTHTSNISIAEISEITTLKDSLIELDADILIINPTHLGMITPGEIKSDSLKIIALQTALTDPSTLNMYDAVISVYDSVEKIRETLTQIINTESDSDKKAELSQREKEIVVCITKGMTNKEIADKLFLSTHTVIAHRRNISSKLEIHSTSGLTIYAIVNKLIDIDSLNQK
ncbi:MAG: LuxR C-terminal-related transcriptional regulator [Rikenellaceae bacterium]